MRDGGSVSTDAGGPWGERAAGGRSASRPQLGVTGRGASAWAPGRPQVPGTAACLHVAHPLRDALRAKLAGGPAVRPSATSPARSLTALESPGRGCVAGNRIGAASPGPSRWFDRTRRTGGTLNSINRLEEMGRIYALVAADLRTLYTIEYQTTNNKRDGKWRAIKLEVKNPELISRTRPGYFAR